MVLPSLQFFVSPMELLFLFLLQSDSGGGPTEKVIPMVTGQRTKATVVFLRLPVTENL